MGVKSERPQVVLKGKSKAYNNGRAAFLRGADLDTNPHVVGTPGKLRQEWFEGWLDLDVYFRIGHVLRRWGVDDWFA